MNSDNTGMQVSFISERGARNAHSKRPRIFHLESTAARSPSFAPHSRVTQTDFDYPSTPNADDEADLRQSVQSLASQATTASQASTISTLPRGRRREISATPRANTYPNPSLPRLDDLIASPDSVPEMRQASISRQHSRIRTSTSRSRSIVFLSIWTFVGVGRYIGVPLSQVVAVNSLYHTSSPARAWVADPVGHRLQDRALLAGPNTVTDTDVYAATLPDVAVAGRDDLNKSANHPSHPEFPEPEPQPIDYKRLIGRVSAWICVVFYLTSRMPQIWKNFRRRSVEGLSILLFVAAFHGNLFYVASILSSPLVQEEEGECDSAVARGDADESIRLLEREHTFPPRQRRNTRFRPHDSLPIMAV